MTGAGVERFEAEVVEDEQIGTTEGFDQARVAPIASGERHVVAEFWPAVIEDGPIVAAGFLPDGAGQPAYCRGARHDKVERRREDTFLQTHASAAGPQIHGPRMQAAPSSESRRSRP